MLTESTTKKYVWYKSRIHQKKYIKKPNERNRNKH